MLRTSLHLSLCLIPAASLSAQWFALQPLHVPPPRFGAALAHHDALGTSVLFGGQPGGIGALTDTWTFDGEDWTQATPATSPPARGGARMVYDEIRSVCVLFGGTSGSPIGGPSFQDTWEWNGSTWTQRTTATLPFRTGRHGLAYDRARGRVVAFGGVPSSQLLGATNQTWEYDGTNWQQRSATTNPGAIDSPSMCYADSLQRVVLFGGVSPVSGAANSTTWLWDGTAWQAAVVFGPSPAPRYGAEMVYDDARGVCVLFGGVTPGGVMLAETWEFDGVTWTQSSAAAPSPRRASAMAFDRTRRSNVLFGGANALTGGTNSVIGDTWTYGATYAPYGQGCLGTNGVPSLRAAAGPRLGLPFTPQLTQLLPFAPIAIVATGFSRTTWLGQPLPFDAGVLGMPGCSLFASPDQIDVIGASNGTGTMFLSIPGDPYFLGVPFYQQGFSFEVPGFNAFGGVLSNATRAVIGQ